MSILIKGLKMPEKGLLEVIIATDGIVYELDRPLIDTEHASVSRIHDAVELPDHGDLIDRDALKNELFTDTTDCDLEMIEFEYVSAAPVVIPAERSEE